MGRPIGEDRGERRLETLEPSDIQGLEQTVVHREFQLLKALGLGSARRTAARASALHGLSLLTNGLGDLAAASPPAEESIAIYRELGHPQGLAEALTVDGFNLVWQGEAALGRARLGGSAT